MKRVAFASTALLLTALTACSTTLNATTTPPTATKTIIDSHGRTWSRIDKDGSYLIGVDVPPGEYRNAGGKMCDWARLRSLDPHDVLAKNTSDYPQVVRIELTDTAFMTRNCGSWQMVPGI